MKRLVFRILVQHHCGSMKKYLGILVFLTVTIVFLANVPLGHAASNSADYNLPISIDHRDIIGEYVFPWPLGDYAIRIETRFIGSSDIPVSCTTDKDVVSPGESLSLLVETSSVELKLNVYLIFSVFKVGESIFSQEIQIPLPQLKTIGDFYATPLTVPVVPFEFIGIPVEISVYASFGLSSSPSLLLKTEGLQPSTTEVAFDAGRLISSEVFTKSEGVGARILANAIKLNFTGYLRVGIGASVLGFLTPLKYDFSPFSLTEFSTSFSTEKELLKIKTPIAMTIDVSNKYPKLSDSLAIHGEVSPRAGGLNVNVLLKEVGMDWIIISSTTTGDDGSFSVNWTPVKDGQYEIKASHDGSEFTTNASSNTISVLVTSPTPGPIIHPDLEQFVLLAAIIGIIAIVAIFILKKRSHS